MGKTFKYNFGKCYRSCKGFRRAKRNKCRSIPPDGWGWEKVPCNLNYMPWRAAENMFHDGWPEYEIVDRLRKKFKLSYYQATDIAEHYFPKYETGSWRWRHQIPIPKNPIPEGYLKIWKQKEIKPKRY